MVKLVNPLSKASDILKPFFSAFEREITLDKAIEQVSYNAMMSYLKDLMISYGAKSTFGAFLFTGPVGAAFTWFVSLLIKFAAKSGKRFLADVAYDWHSKELMIVYKQSMNIIEYDLDKLTAPLTEEQIKGYKQRINNELKKFYNLGRYIRNVNS